MLINRDGYHLFALPPAANCSENRNRPAVLGDRGGSAGQLRRDGQRRLAWNPGGLDSERDLNSWPYGEGGVASTGRGVRWFFSTSRTKLKSESFDLTVIVPPSLLQVTEVRE